MSMAAKIPNVRWRIAALLFFASVINYVDRQTLSVLASEITDELGISDIEYAYVLAAFTFCYMGMYVVAGLLIDRWGTRAALSVSMIWWSIANALHAFSAGAFSLGAFRALLGIGESGNFLAAEKAISEWFPPKERGAANGLVNAAAATGAILAPPLIVFLFEQWGWRAAFVLTGALGFVWMFYWLRWYWPPARHDRVTPEEIDLIERGLAEAGPPKRQIRWRELLRFRQTWGLFLARVVADPLWWFYLFWLPKYLREELGFTMVEIGLTAWMPYLSADLGGIAGGWLSGRSIGKARSAIAARKRLMLFSALVMPIGLLINHVGNSAAVVAIICIVTFAHMSWKTNLMTMTNDIYPTAIVGSAAGLVGLGSGLGGFLFQPYVGYIVQNYSYAPIFTTIAFLHPAAFGLVRLLIRQPLAAAAETPGLEGVKTP